MAGSRAREEGDGYQQHAPGGVFKRNLPRHFGERAYRMLDQPAARRSSFLRGGKRAPALLRSVFPCILASFAVSGFILLAVLHNRATEDSRARNRGWTEGIARERNVLRFMPSGLLRSFDEQGGLDRIRSQPRIGVRFPRLAVVMGTMEKDASSLLLFTLVKNLKEIGYHMTVFTVNDGRARQNWELISDQVSVFSPVNYVDWSLFQGVILSSVEARVAISSLMKEPFDGVPVIWIIQEGSLGERLSLYNEMGWQLISSGWRQALGRSDVVVFPDSSLPMLYTALDSGNFFVIPGTPVDVYIAESYGASHSKIQLRKNYGFNENDLVAVIIGSSLIYSNDTWDYVKAMHFVGPTLVQFANANQLVESLKVVFLSGKNTDVDDIAFQGSDLASQFGFPKGCVKHYGLDGDVNGVLFMADIALYVSSYDELTFPHLLSRAMSFGALVVAPDLTSIKRYIRNKIDGFIFHSRDPKSFGAAFLLAIEEIHTLNPSVARSGKKLSKNMLAQDCITEYAKLLENVVQFPSDTMLPDPINKLRSHQWEWNFLEEETGKLQNEIQNQIFIEGASRTSSSIVYLIEEEFADKSMPEDASNQNDTLIVDYPSASDWEDIRGMELSEDLEMLEIHELADRTERPLESWEGVYSRTRKVSKMKLGEDEREDEELEKVGQLVTVYEIYSGAGAWPFLHHGVLYRAVSLSKEAEESRMGDVRAVLRLPLLNISYYKDILCEYGGILAIANKSSSIHKTPWIGFQSWRASGRKVSLNVEAERSLKQTLHSEANKDVFYYWATVDLDVKDKNGNDTDDFWSICDILNNGHCRSMFEDAFRLMYGIPDGISALPPMPGRGLWSTLHSWVIPTPSFLEFVIFSRMILESLDSLNNNSIIPCHLGSSKLEKQHCYCRLLELLVNVWAYHSGRKMVYINPNSGELKEQHPLDQRRGHLWMKYFDLALLRSMDEDLAEATEDKVYPRKGFLWPLTGEVYCQLVQEKEKELKYRMKREKSRKDKEKQLERKRIGRIQKPLG